MARWTRVFLFFFISALFSPVPAQQSLDRPDDPVRIADLGLEDKIPSAIDLVGPEDGPAGRNRAALIRRMQCWIDGSGGCPVADVNDPRVRALRRFLTGGAVDRDGLLSVHFPDETRIEVRLTRATDLEPNDWDKRVYRTIALPDTVSVPGLSDVPSRPGHFESFDYDGASAIRAALERLKQRLE